MSTLSAFPFIGEQSFATPGAINSPLSIISANIAAVNAAAGSVSGVTITPPSGNTITIASDLSVLGTIAAGPARLGVSSNVTNYLFLSDTSAARSNYIIGSQIGGTADGLNLWDDSGQTMLVSFSKQSIRFFQNVVGPVFDVGGALASTLNAGTFGTGADSKETRIQAAILAAATAGLARVYVPANMYPYSASSMSFIHTVQMVREGGDWTVYDVVAYGAYGDLSRSDATAINAALSAASAHGGGVVYLPNGTYKISQPVDMGDTTVNTIYLKGQGRRDSTIRPDASVHTAVIVGKTGNTTSYGNIIDLTITGIDVGSGHTGCALHMISPQFWTIDNLNIEEFRGNGGTGLYLEGSATAGPPHAYRNQFRQIVCVTTQRPGYLKNADENTFLEAQFGLPTGVSSSSMTCLEITQGRNNVFVSTTLAGDSSSITTGRPSYIGLYLSNPTLGVNAFHQFYGLVCEGFEQGVVIQSTNIQGAQFYNYNSSINSKAMSDGGQDTVDLSVPQQRALFGGAYPFSPLVDLSDGTTSPNLQKGNVYNTTNTSLTTVTTFSNVSSGRLYWFHTGSADNFTVLLDSLNGGTNMRLWGRSNLTLPPETTVPFLAVGGTFYQAGAPIMARVAAGSGNTALFESPLPFAAKLAGTNLTPQFTFGSEASLGLYRSTASVVAVTYGQFAAAGGSQLQPGLCFNSTRSTGFFDNGIPGVDITANNVRTGRFGVRSGLGFLGIEVGSQLNPGILWNSEASLGLYRSATSTVALSYGTFDMTGGGAVLSIASLKIKSGANNSCGTAVLGSNGSVNVANTYVKTGDLIFLTDQTPGGTLGDLEVGGIRDSSGFTVQSTSITDTSTVGWLIIRPT